MSDETSDPLKPYEPSAESVDFIKTHCGTCAHGGLRQMNGRMVCFCLCFWDYPAAMNVTSCNRYEEEQPEG
jgi:deoxyribodipyrimidine photolyase-like uncharacterized protein